MAKSAADINWRYYGDAVPAFIAIAVNAVHVQYRLWSDRRHHYLYSIEHNSVDH
jgi:hypothetical protein